MLTACTIPVDSPPPPTQISTATMPSTFTSTPTLIQTQSPTQTFIPTSPPDFCADIRGTEIINAFSKAIANKNGNALAALVSPTHGLDVRYFRNGNIINYDVEHAKFVFESTFQADWGFSFGSGEPVQASFQEIVLPSLQKVFTINSAITCNQIETGGVTYFPEWQYTSVNFYSVYYSGSAEFGGFDWETWLIGIELIENKPYLMALSHFVWEP